MTSIEIKPKFKTGQFVELKDGRIGRINYISLVTNARDHKDISFNENDTFDISKCDFSNDPFCIELSYSFGKSCDSFSEDEIKFVYKKESV